MPNTILPIHQFITPPQQPRSSTSWDSLPEALLPRTPSEEYYQDCAYPTMNDVMERMSRGNLGIYDSREFTHPTQTTQSQLGQRAGTVSESMLREQAQAIQLSQRDMFTARLTDPQEVVSVASSVGSQIYGRPTRAQPTSPTPVFQPTQELRIVQRSQAGIGVKAMLATQVLQQKWKCINMSNRDEWRDVPIVTE